VAELDPERLAYELLSQLPLERWEAEGGVPLEFVGGLAVAIVELFIHGLPADARARAFEHVTTEELAGIVLPCLEAIVEGRGAAEALEVMRRDLGALLDRALSS
jgi:hypothetical protein